LEYNLNFINGSASTIDKGKFSFTMQLISESISFKRSVESILYGVFDNRKVLIGMFTEDFLMGVLYSRVLVVVCILISLRKLVPVGRIGESANWI